MEKDHAFRATLNLGPYQNYSNEYIEVISRHPFVVQELDKQNEDLQKLKETQTLNSIFLDWLRTSSQNIGNSRILWFSEQ